MSLSAAVAQRQEGSRAKAEVGRLLMSLDNDDGSAMSMGGRAETAATDAGAAPAPAWPRSWCSSTQHPHDQQHQHLEVDRLRRERDAAVSQEHAVLRRERDAALAEAARRGAEAEAASRELAALRKEHAVAALRAEQAASRAAAELGGKAEALERAQAANAELAAAAAKRQLQVDVLETKQAVLLECYQALEAEHVQMKQQRWQQKQGQGQYGLPWGAAARPPLLLQRPETSAADRPALAGMRGGSAGGMLLHSDASWEDGEGQRSTKELVLSSTHLSVAMRCAELQAQLQQQRRAAEAAQQAAAAAEEHAAGLRLLLSRQAGGGAGGGGIGLGPGGAGAGTATAALGQRLEAASCQLERAKKVEAELRQHLSTQRDQALRGALQEAQLQRDLQAMLAAREALASLKSSLQRAAVGQCGAAAAAPVLVL